MKKKVIPVLISVFLLFAILFLGLRITEIRVTGNRMYTADQIEELVFSSGTDRNSIICFVKQLLGKKKSIPFVQDYKISFNGPSSVEVIVYEKSIIGYVTYMSSKMYFDKDGIIVESSNKRLPDIPEVTGLPFGEIVLYKKLPVSDPAVFAMILNLTQALSTYGIPADLIRYDRKLDATLVIGSINILLGSKEEMNGKLTELAGMLPKLEGLSGTLDLSGYDPSLTNQMYSFKKH